MGAHWTGPPLALLLRPPPPLASSLSIWSTSSGDLSSSASFLDKIGPNLGAAPVTVSLSLSHICISELEEGWRG